MTRGQGPFGWGIGGENWFEGAPWRFRFAGRRMDRGDVKLLILTVLTDGPKHGYEIIKEIEKRSQGAYAPSAGVVYPTLQMLEDMGYVRSASQAERRVYEIAEAGRAFLAEKHGEADAAWGRFEGWDWKGLFGNEEQRQLQREMVDLAGALFGSGRIFRADAAALKEVRDAIRQAREKIDTILGRREL